MQPAPEIGTDSEHRRYPCPECAEQILAAARKCRFCGSRVWGTGETTKQPLASVSPAEGARTNDPARRAHSWTTLSILAVVGFSLGFVGMAAIVEPPTQQRRHTDRGHLRRNKRSIFALVRQADAALVRGRFEDASALLRRAADADRGTAGRRARRLLRAIQISGDRNALRRTLLHATSEQISTIAWGEWPKSMSYRNAAVDGRALRTAQAVLQTVRTMRATRQKRLNNPADIDRGRKLWLTLLSRHGGLDAFYQQPTLWGAAVRPRCVIHVVHSDWVSLSTTDRAHLGLYARSQIARVKAAPLQHCSPAGLQGRAADLIRTNAGRMTNADWGIMVGRLSPDGRDILADEIFRPSLSPSARTR